MTYQTVVSGKTFDADKQLMQKVKHQGRNDVQFVENNGDHRVSVVFCPITSRIGSDVEAAMDDVKGKGKFEMIHGFCSVSLNYKVFFGA